MIRLPGNVRYPPPPAPSPLPPTTSVSITSATAATGCTLLGLLPTQCTVSTSGGDTTIAVNNSGAPFALPNVSLSSHVTLEIAASSAPAQVVNINSLDLTGGGTIAVKATASNQSVLINLAGKNPDGTDMTTVMDFGGNSGGQFQNDSTCAGCSVYDASMLQFVYGGPATINLRGNSGAAATVYAPNSDVNFNGTADLYGSMLGKTVTNGGNANIHYDRRLERDFYVEGAQMLGTFSWKRN
jgi:choice-of-anchor A domain-containing protein